MELQDLFIAVRRWGVEKGITGAYGTGTIKAQWGKVREEIQETEDAIAEYQSSAGSIRAVEDGIGDSIVTLILLAELMGLSAEQCLNAAYREINQRTGKMVDGTFVKDNGN